MARGVSGWCPKISKKIFLTFLGLGTNVVKVSIVNSELLFQLDTLVYTDASDDACGAQLIKEHDGPELPVAFLSHTFTYTQCKWSTTEQEACGIYYAVIKQNYYLHRSDIVVNNDRKPPQKFLNGKYESIKVNRWSLELTTYNITFE